MDARLRPEDARRDRTFFQLARHRGDQAAHLRYGPPALAARLHRRQRRQHHRPRRRQSRPLHAHAHLQGLHDARGHVPGRPRRQPARRHPRAHERGEDPFRHHEAPARREVMRARASAARDRLRDRQRQHPFLPHPGGRSLPRQDRRREIPDARHARQRRRGRRGRQDSPGRAHAESRRDLLGQGRGGRVLENGEHRFLLPHRVDRRRPRRRTAPLHRRPGEGAHRSPSETRHA